MRRRLTSQEREELVLDLYHNQNKNYRQITKEVKICPRDIKIILDKDARGAQGEQSMSESSKAYKLFDEGKSPLDIAIALNLREDKATQYYKEFWDLRQLYDFNKIYVETNGNLGFLVSLYKLGKAAGLNAELLDSSELRIMIFHQLNSITRCSNLR